jgi:hypothetical protein
LLQTSSESMKQQRTKVPVKKKKKSIGGWIMPCTVFTDRTNSNSGSCFVYFFILV